MINAACAVDDEDKEIKLTLATNGGKLRHHVGGGNNSECLDEIDTAMEGGWAVAVISDCTTTANQRAIE